MTVEQARKHVDDGIISVDPLAILAVGHQAHQLGTLLQVPAFRKNGTPIIVPACLIQCGDDCVEFRANIPSAETPTVEAVTMEFTLKRTHVDDWKTTATPTHYLGLQCPELRGPGKILASWSIKPFKDRKVCMHSAADSWHGYLKLDLTLTATAQVLKRSGFNGIFFTPRGSDKKPHSKFAVVPLPGMTLDKVQKHAGEVANTLGVAVWEANSIPLAFVARKNIMTNWGPISFRKASRLTPTRSKKETCSTPSNIWTPNTTGRRWIWHWMRWVGMRGPFEQMDRDRGSLLAVTTHLVSICVWMVVWRWLLGRNWPSLNHWWWHAQLLTCKSPAHMMDPWLWTSRRGLMRLKPMFSGIIDDKMQVAAQQIQMLQNRLGRHTAEVEWVGERHTTRVGKNSWRWCWNPWEAWWNGTVDSSKCRYIGWSNEGIVWWVSSRKQSSEPEFPTGPEITDWNHADWLEYTHWSNWTRTGQTPLKGPRD